MDVGGVLNERDQGAAYNLRDRQTLRPPRRPLEVMENSHSTNTYETPTTLLQSVLEHVTGNYAGKDDGTESIDIKKWYSEKY